MDVNDTRLSTEMLDLKNNYLLHNIFFIKLKYFSYILIIKNMQFNLYPNKLDIS